MLDECPTVEMILEFVLRSDSALVTRKHQAIEKHLESCLDCRDNVDWMRKGVEIMRRAYQSRLDKKGKSNVLGFKEKVG